ncbi:MAG: tRNA (adenosine(37)-N6)-threonylcarbamoyltransferase complex ATPase subunit type 1 TsaE [Coxiella sp. (in: Bacteria)]|nr:MAG: tRNA (adenosine(37)-N6)-threonylcarbamoyltransferase complex ATPase subunit type 1 TsaE [Coxiella sp. (in: g-proteobacteria)]
MKTINTPEAMEQFGAELAQEYSAPSIITLEGELGSGKTTLVRGFLRQLGHDKTVKSPTYGLVETYSLDGVVVHHFDLYRVSDMQELEEMGFADYFEDDAICLIEWPRVAAALLPKSDMHCVIEIHGDERKINRQ